MTKSPRLFFWVAYAISMYLLLGCATLPTKPQGMTVTVKVVDKGTQAPLVGGTVKCNGHSLRVGETGAVTFTNVPAGLLKIYVRKDGYWDSGFTWFREDLTQAFTVQLTQKEIWK